MTSLEDRADDGSEDWVLAPESAGVYRIETDQLVSADDIGNEYPEFGEFLHTTRMSATSDGDWIEEETVYVECPAGLARAVLEAGAGPGDIIGIGNPTKTEGGRWRFTVSKPETVDDLL